MVRERGRKTEREAGEQGGRENGRGRAVYGGKRDEVNLIPRFGSR